MNKIKYILLSLGLVTSFGLAAMPVRAGALDVFKDACSGEAKDTAICKDRAKNKATDFVSTLVDVLLYVLAAVSVVVIVISGIFYTTSMGDTAALSKAKNTLLYAVVGLIVALLAYAIVHFVIVRFVA